MTGDKNKFVKINRYEGGVVRFRDNVPKPIIGMGSISLDGKTTADNVLLVDGLRHNLLSVE